jgi:hypothetical protein
MKLSFCAVCGNTEHVGHFPFVERDGRQETNLLTLCSSCYARRNERTHIERTWSYLLST